MVYALPKERWEPRMNRTQTMKKLLRTRTTVKGLLQVVLLGVLAALPTPVHAQVHGGTIQKNCVPAQVNPANPTETLTCTITVTNADTFGDSLRIDGIFDNVQHASVCPAVQAQCPGAAHVGTPPACFTDNLLDNTPVILPVLTTSNTETHVDCVPSSDAQISDHLLRDLAIAIGADLGIGNPPTCIASVNPPTKVDNPACFTLTFPAQVMVVTTTTSTTSTTTTTIVARVCDSVGACKFLIDGQECTTCSDLQAAVDVVAKTNSVSSAATKTIAVQGRCVGRPVLIEGLFNVVITGVTPSGGCPADFPANYKSLKAALTSTIARQDPPGTLRTGSNGEVIKVRNSSRVAIKFRNIRA